MKDKEVKPVLFFKRDGKYWIYGGQHSLIEPPITRGNGKSKYFGGGKQRWIKVCTN